MFIPLPDASQGDTGFLISDRPGCSEPPAHVPEVLADYAVPKGTLLLASLTRRVAATDTLTAAAAAAQGKLPA